jgi:hypothetical protein
LGDVYPTEYTRRVLKLAAAAIAAFAVSQPPAWIGRAIPPPIVAWVEADVLGNHYPEGIAVSKAGGTYFVGVADSRPDPPEMVLDYDLVRARGGSSVQWLRAGRLTRTNAKEIGVDVRISRTGGERAWILRVERRRLRLLREFAADRIRLAGRTVDLYWPGKHETWRFERGAYRLVAPS